jgi:DNA repair/transcription protein MET18/MMS19
VDILKTIRACLDDYKNPDQSVVPFVNQIWGSLKYEVRNGEIEDTIWGTLEVLKSVALRLEGDNLRDYTLAVTRDCVNDLGNTLYTASAGRLLVSVLSAKPSAFVLIAAPAITHIKENLRHPKAPVHSQDLLRILHVVLETRLLLVDTDMSLEDREDFGAVDNYFKPLYHEVYNSVIEKASKPNAAEDDLKTASQAVQGAGALICQKPAKSINPSIEPTNGGSDRLLPEAESSKICENLFAILSQSGSGHSRSGASDELINETTKALQRAIRSFPSAYKLLVDQAMTIIRSSQKDGGDDEAIQTITSIGAHLAFIGCSELPTVAVNGLKHFIYFTRSFLSELYDALDSKATSKVWCSVVATIQSAIRYFNDACKAADANSELPIEGESWVQKIEERYPELGSSGKNEKETANIEASSVAEVRNEFLQVSLFIARQLYRRATKPTGNGTLGLSDDFNGGDIAAENQYLHLVSTLAGFVVHEMSEPQQLSLQAENLAISLFHEESVTVPEAITDEKKVPGYEESVLQSGSGWDWLVLESLNVLSFSILEALRPSSIDRLVSLHILIPASKLMCHLSSPVALPRT